MGSPLDLKGNKAPLRPLQWFFTPGSPVFCPLLSLPSGDKSPSKFRKAGNKMDLKHTQKAISILKKKKKNKELNPVKQ